MKVLAATFADPKKSKKTIKNSSLFLSTLLHSRKRLVFGEIIRHVPPDGLKGGHAAGKVDRRQIGRTDDVVAEIKWLRGQEADDARCKAGLLKNFVDDPVGEKGSAAWLPHHGISHQRRCRGEIARNGGEVEGRNGGDKTFETSKSVRVAHLIARTYWLVLVDLLRVVGVKAEKISELTSGIDFCLNDSFS